MAEYYKAWEKEVSTIRIGNASQLESFLKILSEERAQEDVLPEKQKSMEKAIERDLKRYSKIEEQEDEEAPEAEEDEPEEDSPPEEEGEDVDDEDVDVSPPEQDDSGEEEVVSPDITYYKIRDEINDIRAAPSLKDKEVKQDMEQWLDRLSDSEKEMLYSYLDTVDKIMRSKVTGSDAQDPSESPTSLELQGDEESEEGSDEEESSEEVSGDSEDTSPPIKAGGDQDLSEIRKKVQALMLG
jgi:hypothetical protein